MLLDDKGFAELAAELNGLLERIKEIEKDSAERLEGMSDHSDAELDTGLVMMLFENGEAQLPTQREGRSRSRSAAKR
jgi:hypothetical protein